ncbi:glycosyltransferase 87 family protein [Candidatus Chloroploca asiatica]|uniref:DUF2029 domain-containing protein n=1 Tax=Candidatus Chloroploca asiatica TaxID=1506545 RepID=A0A2H3L5H0_9CHLR|nr:glycosyltransferase 87 family protein [Candidatus Chloroploca asiatica]PDW00144.1 hypothetical protein A9Q02_22020 [Candidatus Chloroploca asiatica]
MHQLFVDWRLLVGATQYWLAGGDPYGAYILPDGLTFEPGWFAYPPPVLLILIPLTVFPWFITGLLVQILAVVGFEYWSRQTTGQMTLVWMVLWLPLLQGVVLGQTTLLVVVVLLLAEFARRQGLLVAAGLLLALAILKPQAVALPVLWLLSLALIRGQWSLLVAFFLSSLLLWGTTLLLAGPEIYLWWLRGLQAYRSILPNRPLLFPPAGWLLGGMACFLWYRYGRGDPFGLALLVNTLIYPLSVVYVALALAPVVMRWRPQTPWYPLVLSWFIPLFFTQLPRTAETIAATTQLVVATALFAALLPPLRWRLR